MPYYYGPSSSDIEWVPSEVEAEEEKPEASPQACSPSPFNLRYVVVTSFYAKNGF